MDGGDYFGVSDGQTRVIPGQKSQSGKFPLQVATADRQSVVRLLTGSLIIVMKRLQFRSTD